MDINTVQQAQQVIQDTQAMAAQVGWGHVGLATLVGVAAGIPGQAILEHWLAGPKIPARVKALAPTALALGLGYAATHFGITPEQATAGATLFASAMHIYNETPLAAVTNQPDAPK
ncbi:MAG: hypothetical protein V4498_00655 [candidate division FCPU426 bacterium]